MCINQPRNQYVPGAVERGAGLKSLACFGAGQHGRYAAALDDHGVLFEDAPGGFDGDDPGG